MTDRQLLEAAARAAGYEIAWADGPDHDPVKLCDDIAAWEPWNPLADDGDAFRLAVKLDIYVMQVVEQGHVSARIRCGPRSFWNEPLNGNRYAATRRAIVRAAAAMAERGE